MRQTEFTSEKDWRSLTLKFLVKSRHAAAELIARAWLVVGLPICVLLAACHVGTRRADLHSVVISLERTQAPEGTSPSYKVTLYPNGSVEYVGEVYVDVPGAQVAHLAPKALRDVLNFADQIHFFELQDHYYEECTDVPTAIVAIQINGKIKRVSNDYSGCARQTSGPQVDLANLAERIDTAAGTARWIKCDDQCLATLIQAGLNLNARSPTTGDTPLITAIHRKDLAKTMLLLNAGALVNLADNNGTTPLMRAVMEDQPGYVRELLRRGADVNAKDAKGFKASQMTGDPKILKLLR